MNMDRDILDFLFWLMLALTLGFLILKILGVINTPEWINYFPIFTLMFAAGIAYQKLINFIGRIYNRTDYLKKKIDELDNKISSLNNKVQKLEVLPVDNQNRIIALEKGQEMIFDILKDG